MPDEEDKARKERGRAARKERVLHTRIPAGLEEELKVAASSLRMPVSNLVRSILEDAITAADRAGERVESGLQRAARTVHDGSERFAERVETSLQRAARLVQSEKERITGRVEAEALRAAESIEESERLANRVGQAVERAARTVQHEGHLIAGKVESEFRRVARHVTERSASASPPAPLSPELADVIAFQSVVLAVPTTCAQCRRVLERGEDAALGIGSDPSRRVFVCGDCLPRKRGTEGDANVGS